MILVSRFIHHFPFWGYFLSPPLALLPPQCVGSGDPLSLLNKSYESLTRSPSNHAPIARSMFPPKFFTWLDWLADFGPSSQW